MIRIPTDKIRALIPLTAITSHQREVLRQIHVSRTDPRTLELTATNGKIAAILKHKTSEEIPEFEPFGIPRNMLLALGIDETKKHGPTFHDNLEIDIPKGIPGNRTLKIHLTNGVTLQGVSSETFPPLDRITKDRSAPVSRAATPQTQSILTAANIMNKLLIDSCKIIIMPAMIRIEAPEKTMQPELTLYIATWPDP